MLATILGTIYHLRHCYALWGLRDPDLMETGLVDLFIEDTEYRN